MRRCVLVVGLVAASLLDPAGATAAADRVVTLTAGPVAIDGYQMTVLAIRSLSSTRASLSVHFHRARPHGHEDDEYWFAKGVQFGLQPGLAGATAIARVGRFGTARITFSASRPGSRGAPPPGCRGPLGVSRAGTLRGTLRVDTHTRFFGTVRRIPTRATLRRGQRPTCFPAPPARPPGLSLLVGTGHGTAGFQASRRVHDSVVESMTVQEYYPGLHALLFDALVTHTLVAHAPRSTFSATVDLRSGHVAAATPLFAGSLRFATDRRRVGCGRPGRLSGSLLAQFDSIGTFDLFSHGSRYASIDRFPCRDR